MRWTKTINWLWVFLAFLLMHLAGCNQRFGYLSKVGVAPKRGIVSLELENLSPQVIHPHFEHEIKTYIEKQLHRQGYKVSDKNPLYVFHIDIRVDSAMTTGTQYAAPKAYSYSRLSKGIILELKLRSAKTNWTVWQKDYDLYFFAEEKRDLSRTKSVLKFLINQMAKEQ